MKKTFWILVCAIALLCAACADSASPIDAQQAEPIRADEPSAEGDIAILTPDGTAEESAEEAEEPVLDTEEPVPDAEESVPESEEPASEPTEALTEEPNETPTEEPTPEPTPNPTPTPRPTPAITYGAPKSFKPTKALTDEQLPVVYRMYEQNPKGKKEAQMFTYDLNMDGKAEKISFKLDYKKNRTTITAGKKSIPIDEGAELMSAMLIDLDPETLYKDLVICIDMASDDYVTIVLHFEDGKLVRDETVYTDVWLGEDGILRRYQNTDLLGTHSGWRSCWGEHFETNDEWLDMHEWTEEEIAEEIKEIGDYSFLLKLKRELPCTVDGQPATLPVGTMLYMIRFHESQRFAEICTTDGVTAVLTFSTFEDEDNYWPYTIDGIPQDDYFEYELLYAD